jgi:hypothetical protein
MQSAASVALLLVGLLGLVPLASQLSATREDAADFEHMIGTVVRSWQ